MKVDIIDLSSKKVGDIELNDSIFSIDPREDILARVVKWQLAKRRSGNHKVKTRAEVKHTTRKPFKQKGTGRARQGMTSVSQMRGGGVVFGPVVRDHSHKLLKKVRMLGLKSALSAKAKEGKLKVVDSLSVESHKTKDLLNSISGLQLTSALFIDKNNSENDNFKRASSNIVKFNVLPTMGMNVYDILNHDTLLITKDAVSEIMERLDA